MVVTGKRGGLLAVGVAAALMSGCSVFAPKPESIEYLPQDPPPGGLAYGKKVYVDDGQCPASQVKLLVGGDAKRNIPRQVECVPRPQ